MLTHVSEALGGNPEKYPGKRYDLIYDQPDPYDSVKIYSENCPGLDDEEVG